MGDFNLHPFGPALGISTADEPSYSIDITMDHELTLIEETLLHALS